MRVFIIEDNPGDCRLLQEKLKDIDIYESYSAETLEDASQDIKKLGNIDVIFLDINLPGSQGKETLERVREIFALDNILKTIPIIAITGVEDYEIGKQAIQNGIKDFLIKDELNIKSLERSINYATYARTMPKRSVLSKYLRGAKSRF